MVEVFLDTDVAFDLIPARTPYVDKEYGLPYFTALRHHCDYFLSRNVRDYTHDVARLSVLTPTQFLKEIHPYP